MRQDSTRPRWQGQTRDVPEVRHRWEQEWTSIQNREFVEPPRKNQRRLFFLLLAAIALVGGFIYLLAFSPQRAPLAVICLQNYQWPLPPNSGVAEDLSGLAELDRQNFEVEDLSGQWQANTSSLDALSDYLQQSLAGNRQAACLIYISGYGAVNGDGEPCLILPGYAPDDETNWLPVRGILQRINARPNVGNRVLLMLDCVKERDNWPLGITSSTWPARLRQLYRDVPHPNLAILSSVSDGQQSVASSMINGTVFGLHVRLGLAGLADRTSDPGATGNGDGQVSLREMGRFVRENVSRWVMANRGDVQLPELLCDPASDFRLCWSLNDAAQADLESRMLRTSTSPISPQMLNELWTRLEKMKAQGAVQFAPAVMSDFEHRLLWLTELAGAGRTGAQAEPLSRQLRDELDSILDQLEEASGSWVDRSRSFSIEPEPSNLRLDLGSIGLNQFFGTIDQAEASALQDLFQSVIQPSAEDREPVDAALERLPLQDRVLASRLRELARLQVWPTPAPIDRWVQLYRASESISLPSDLRVQSRIRSQVESFDGYRQQAMDQLFVGDNELFATACVEAEAVLAQLESEAGGQLNQLVDDYRDRDEMLAELPYLARWQLRWQLPGADQLISDRQAAMRGKRLALNDLIADVNDASLEVGAGSGSGPNGPASGSQWMAKWRTLRSEFDQAVEALLNRSETDVSMIHEMDSILETPLVTADRRRSLVDKRNRLEADLIEKYLTAADAEDAAPDATVFEGIADAAIRLVNEAELQGTCEGHPLFALLGVSAADAAVADDVKLATLMRREATARRARRRLAAIALDRSQPAIDAASTTSEIDPIELQRSRLEQRSATFRRVAGLFHELPLIRPASDLRKFELQELLIWHARRAQTDFYGFPAGELMAELQQEPAFSLLVGNCLRRLEQPDLLPIPAPERLALLREQLSELRRIAVRGVEVAVEDITPTTESATELEVTLTGNPGAEPTQLPAGAMAFRLAEDDGLVTTLRDRINFPPAAGTSNLSIEVPRRLAGTYDQLNLFFRGHDYPAPVVAKGLGGYTINWSASQDQSSTVSLMGDRKGRPSIVLALDCSQSMGELIQAEAVGNQRSPRLQLAKGALSTMLKELASRGDSRVGIRFFGHRLGWSTDEPTVVMSQDDYAGEIPEGLLPENDVELVLPLGRFTEAEGQSVLGRMNSAKPWGQSPLYLTLLKAIQDFETEPADVDRSIVVITDGLNYQFSPASEALTAQRKTSREDLAAALERTPVPIYILGFGISAAEEKQAADEFRSIAELSRGGYFPVDNGQELLDVLENQLDLGTYDVFTSRGETVAADSRPTTLGQAATLPNPGAYQLSFDSVQLPFEVEGGEALEFHLREKSNLPVIDSYPFTNNAMATATMSSSQDSRSLTLRVQRPSVLSDGVRFSVAFQFDSQAFTPRPAEMWIEVHPEVEAETDQPPVSYIFYDRQFGSGLPVPVVGWKAEGWQATCDSAQVVVYCKFSATEPTHEIPIAQWTGNRDLLNADQTLPGIDGFQFRLDLVEHEDGGGTVRVVEEHDDGSAGLYSLKLDLTGDESARPARVERTFDVRNQRAIHAFHFERAALQAYLEGSNSGISFTPRAALLQDAWSLDDGPVRIRLGTGDGVLPLEAAEGLR